MTEDERVGWPHRLNGHEFERAQGDAEGRGGLACCHAGVCKESDTIEQLSNNITVASTFAGIPSWFYRVWVLQLLSWALEFSWRGSGLYTLWLIRCLCGASRVYNFLACYLADMTVIGKCF